MKKGILIFAHNSRQIDYALMATIAGGMAKKNLKVPVSLVTDKSTVDWMKSSKVLPKAKKIFEHILEVERPDTTNQRLLFDGYSNKMVPFINGNRLSAYDITPYDRTLVIDSDFIIMSDSLNEYWDVDSSILISPAMNDIRGDRIGILDKWVSETGIKLYWATTFMFTKNKESKFFFELVHNIKSNYEYYSDLFRFNPNQFRNDIAFSVAKHILHGFDESFSINLPAILTASGKDFISSVEENKIRFLLNDDMSESHVIGALVNNRDVHVMNKQDIIRFADTFLSHI